MVRQLPLTILMSFEIWKNTSLPIQVHPWTQHSPLFEGVNKSLWSDYYPRSGLWQVSKSLLAWDGSDDDCKHCHCQRHNRPRLLISLAQVIFLSWQRWNTRNYAGLIIALLATMALMMIVGPNALWKCAIAANELTNKKQNITMVKFSLILEDLEKGHHNPEK